MNSCEDPPKNSYPVHVSLASGDCEQCGVCRKNSGTQGWHWEVALSLLMTLADDSKTSPTNGPTVSGPKKNLST